MKNYKKGFVIPLLIAIIALLGIGGGAYVYINKKTTEKVSNSSKNNTNLSLGELIGKKLTNEVNNSELFCEINIPTKLHIKYRLMTIDDENPNGGMVDSEEWLMITGDFIKRRFSDIYGTQYSQYNIKTKENTFTYGKSKTNDTQTSCYYAKVNFNSYSENFRGRYTDESGSIDTGALYAMGLNLRQISFNHYKKDMTNKTKNINSIDCTVEKETEDSKSSCVSKKYCISIEDILTIDLDDTFLKGTKFFEIISIDTNFNESLLEIPKYCKYEALPKIQTIKKNI